MISVEAKVAAGVAVVDVITVSVIDLVSVEKHHCLCWVPNPVADRLEVPHCGVIYYSVLLVVEVQVVGMKGENYAKGARYQVEGGVLSKVVVVPVSVQTEDVKMKYYRY